VLWGECFAVDEGVVRAFDMFDEGGMESPFVVDRSTIVVLDTFDNHLNAEECEP
jgi:hypothetical protein